MRYVNIEVYADLYVLWHVQYQTSKLYTQNASNFVVSWQNFNFFVISKDFHNPLYIGSASTSSNLIFTVV